ncbi:hypothetical protein PENTCL1PPCAC_19914, partial [Pristionchus entomophagus]
RSPPRLSLPSLPPPSLARMTPLLLLLGWIAAAPLLLLACKKTGKPIAKESTCSEGTKKSSSVSTEVKEHNAKINAGMKR